MSASLRSASVFARWHSCAWCREGLAVFTFVLFWTVFFDRILLDHTYTFLGGWDPGIQSFAWYAHVASSLQEGSFPFWDMHTEAGEFFIGEVQTAAFYPLVWILSLGFDKTDLEGFQHWAEAYGLFHALLGSLFAYALMRELKIRPACAVFGAILAIYFGAIATRIAGQPNIYAGMVYLPGVLFLALKAWHQRNSRRGTVYASLAGLALGFCILSGHLYSYIHTAFVLFLLAAFGTWRNPHQYFDVVRLLALIALCSLLVAYPQLDAMLEYFSRANKWYGADFTSYPHVVPFSEFSRWAFSSWETLLDGRCSSNCSEGRTLYMGLAAWPLALLALAVIPQARKVIVPVLVIMLVIASAGDNIIGQVLYHVPVLSNVRIPSRILFAFPLFIGILAAAGLHWLLARSVGRHWKIVAVVAVMLVFGLDVGNQKLRWASGGFPRNVMPYDPATYYNDPLTRWLEQQLPPDSLYRWQAEPKELLPPNLGQVNGTNSLSGHRSSMHQNYFQVQSAPSDRSGWSPKLGLKFLVTRMDYPQFDRVFTDAGRNVYEFADALPLVHGIGNAGEFELPIGDVKWRTNSLQFVLGPEYTRAPDQQIFFGITWFPGWRLIVDGQQRELSFGQPAEAAFMSAALLPGDREFRLQYTPPRVHAYWIVPLLYLFWLGWLLSGRKLPWTRVVLSKA